MRRGLSLGMTLALWIAPALGFLFLAALWMTSTTTNDLADSAYDRSIAGAIRAIDLNISTQSGGVGVELPYPLFESFEATASGQVYFRVSTDDGLVQIGDTFLPDPPAVNEGSFRFYNADVFGNPIRVGVFRRTLTAPLYGAATPQAIVIEVAESTRSREEFRRSLFIEAMGLNAAMVLTVVALLLIGITLALRPLRALRQNFDRRDPDDLSPVNPAGLPKDIRPLIETFNRLMSRHAEHTEAQRRFLDDASHQLKTPIAVLRTQIDYALFQKNADRSTLESMRGIVDRAARTTAQFLMLAKTRNFAQGNMRSPAVAVDLGALLQEVARLHLPAARRRRVDLELDLPDDPVRVRGAEALLFEAFSNLVDNAVRASPDGGAVVIEVGDGTVRVLDQGAGMAEDDLALVGDRFHRASEGTGLGLSVVVAIAKAHGGSFRAENLAGGGLVAIFDMSGAKNAGGGQD